MVGLGLAVNRRLVNTCGATWNDNNSPGLSEPEVDPVALGFCQHWFSADIKEKIFLDLSKLLSTQN